MTKKILWAFIIFIPLIFNSCIEIKEKITVYDNGSGNIELLVDLGKAGKYLSQQSQKTDISFIEQIKRLPDEVNDLLSNQKGISNIRSKADHDKSVYMVSFDFKNTRALNDALFALFKQKKKLIYPNLIVVTKHKIKHVNPGPLVKKYVLKEESNMINDMFYQFINIESTFVLPRKAKKISNIKATTQNEEKTVILKYTLSSLLYDEFDYGIKIKY